MRHPVNYLGTIHILRQQIGGWVQLFRFPDYFYSLQTKYFKGLNSLMSEFFQQISFWTYLVTFLKSFNSDIKYKKSPISICHARYYVLFLFLDYGLFSFSLL